MIIKQDGLRLTSDVYRLCFASSRAWLQVNIPCYLLSQPTALWNTKEDAEEEKSEGRGDGAIGTTDFIVFVKMYQGLF